MCEVIDESYNASPVTVAAAIRNLQNINPGPSGRRIAVLGDMLELGESSPQAHAALSKDLIEAGIDLVFTAGPLMSRLRDALPVSMRGGEAYTAEELLPVFTSALQPGDVVLIKGSQGGKMRQLVDGLKQIGGAAKSGG